MRYKGFLIVPLLLTAIVSCSLAETQAQKQDLAQTDSRQQEQDLAQTEEKKQKPSLAQANQTEEKKQEPSLAQANEQRQKQLLEHREIFPDLSEEQGGVINVKDYGAKGDGVTDDTQAFKNAIERDEIANSGKIVYVPKGTYLVSETINWPRGAHGGLYYKRTTLLGESRQESIIKLKDNAPGFSGEESKPVIDTKENRANGFRNRVENLTVNTGSGNSNAIGIKLNSNNGGGIFNVSVISDDGQGSHGIGLTDAELGPLLVKDVSVTGFNSGIRVGGGTTNSVNLENITLEGQKKAGIEHAMQVLNIRNLKSTNQVPAIQVFARNSNLTLIGADLTGTNSQNQTAIVTSYNQDSDGTPDDNQTINTFLADIKQQGYQNTARVYNCDTGQPITLTGNITEWSCGEPLLGLSQQTKILRLPTKETPYLQRDLNNVAVVEGDTGADIQAAIDTPGVKTVFLPNRQYQVDEPILIRGSVREIIGMRAYFARESVDPIFRFEDGDEPIVSLENLEGPSIEHNSKRTLVVKKASLKSYNNTQAGTGDVFFEDIVSGLMRIQNQNAWARSLNVEAVPPDSEAKIVNDGGSLWILGLKTEKPGTIIKTENNGSTEVLGGLIYINADIPETNPPQAQYINDESRVAILTRPYMPSAMGYEVLIREIRNGTTKDIPNPNRRSLSRSFPYLGY